MVFICKPARMEQVCDNPQPVKEETQEPEMSATMSKKQLRRQQRQEKWMSIKAEVRAKEKQRKKTEKERGLRERRYHGTHSKKIAK